MTPQIDRRPWIIISLLVVALLLCVPLSKVIFNIDYNYTLTVVAVGGAALGILASVIGCFAVLRHESLLGDALSHAALPGVAIAFLIAGREIFPLLIGAAIASWLGTQFALAITRTTRIKQDTALGIVLTGWFAVGLALLSYIQSRPDASQAGLDKFIFGQAAAMVQRDVEVIAFAALISFALLALFWKQLKLITFDREFAQANGVNVRGLDLLLSTLLVVTIVVGLQLAGVILMVGLLIAPAVAARQWVHKLGQMVFLSAVFGAFAGGSGAIISGLDVALPTGPLMIVMASIIVFLSLAFAPGRGLIWQKWQQWRTRSDIADNRAANLPRPQSEI